MKEAFDGSCFDKCCSRDGRDVCCMQEIKIERDGTCTQHIVPLLPGSVASGVTHRLHHASALAPTSAVATGPPSPVVLPPDDDDSHNNLDRQHILSNDRKIDSTSATHSQPFLNHPSPRSVQTHSCIDPRRCKLFEP